MKIYPKVPLVVFKKSGLFMISMYRQVKEKVANAVTVFCWALT